MKSMVLRQSTIECLPKMKPPFRWLFWLLRLKKTLLDLCFLENHMFSSYWIIFTKLKFFCLRSWIFFRYIVVACVSAAEQLNNNGIRLRHSASPEEGLIILRNFAETDGFPTNCQAFEYL